MNKKKLMALAIAGVLTVGALGAGTLAYFTDTQNVTNIITMGDVDADLKEPNYPAGEDGGEIKNLTPGAEFKKDPTITLKADSEDAYVRVQLKLSANKKNANNETENFLLSDVEVKELFANVDVNQTNWFVIAPTSAEADGSFTYTLYYKDILTNKETGSNAAKVFENVKIPTSWGNKFKNVSVVMDVTADVIQADNFTPVTNADGMITSWGDVTIEK